MSAASRWRELSLFVLVLTLLLVLLVAVLPPLILDEMPPAWVLRKAARAASSHGDPEPVEAEWFVTTRAEAAGFIGAPAGEAGPAPSPAATGTWSQPAGSAAPSPQPSPVKDPGRKVHVVVMRGGFDRVPPGAPPLPGASERWLVVAYDSLTHERWRIAVLASPPAFPAEAASFEF